MATEKKDGREEIMIPRALNGEDPNFFVSVNGVNYLLPRGKKSLVPKEVAFEIRRSWDAQAAWDDMVSDMTTANPQ